MKPFLSSRRWTVALAVATALFLAAITAYNGVGRKTTARLILAETLRTLESEAAFDQIHIESVGNDIRRQTLVFASLIPVRGMARAHVNGGVDPVTSLTYDWCRTNLEPLFADAVQRNSDIIQLRLIGTEGGGMELVRVHRAADGRSTVVAAGAGLRPKGDHDYVREALRLKPEQVFVARPDLNWEPGLPPELERSTLRVSTPVHTPQGEPFGVVVVSFDFFALAKEIDLAGRIRGPRSHLTYLVDEEGRYFIAPEVGRAYRHERSPGSPGWNDEFIEDPSAARALGVPLPPGLRAFRGPSGAVLFREPDPVLFGSELSPIRLRLWQGVRLSAVEDELRRTHDSQNAAAAGLAGAILAIFGLTAAGFSRRQAALERRQADRLERATRAGQVGLWDYNPRTGLFEWNEEWSRILGAFPDEFQRRPQALLDLVHPEDRASVLSQIGELAGKTTIGAMFRIVRPDGGVRMISIQGALRRDDEGKLLQLSGTGTDITERHAAEAAVVSSEEKYRSMTESASSAIVSADHMGRIVAWNVAAEKMFGHTAAEAVGQPLTIVIPERRRAAHIAGMQRLHHGQPAVHMGSTVELEGLRKDGSEFPLELSLSTWRQDGRVFFTGIIQDITLRRTAEADLRQFKSTLDATHDCVFLFWEDTLEFFYVNDGACRMMGFTASELLAMHPYDLKPDYPRPKFLELIAPLLEGRQSSLRLETVHRHKDGHDIPVEISLQKVAPPNERARFINIVTDTTARREARAALALSNQRMHLAINAASIGVWEWDLRTNQIQWDRRMFELYDAPPTPDGIVGYATWHDAVHPEEVAAQEAYMQEVVEGRKPIGRRQFRIIRPGGGAIRHIEAAEVLVRDENGIAVKLLGTNLDITDRMEAEQNRQTHIRTLESMDQINRVIQRTADPEQMPRRVLESVLALFPCDGVSLIHPCEPAGGTWGVAVDACRADVPAGPKPSAALPITAELGEIFRLAQAHRRTVMQAGPESGTALPEPFREVFGAESCMLIRIDPEGGAGWILMIRSCAAAHVWSQDEERILLEVASRLEGALSGLLLFRQVLDLNSSLEGRVQDRTAELARSNEELRRSNDDLERFAFAASHDLKSPLKAVASLGACRTYAHVLNPTLYDSIWRVLISGEGVLMVQKSSFRPSFP